MFDNYSPMNLAKAISEILTATMNYINSIVKTNFKIGLCVISPKTIENIDKPTDEKFIKIRELAEEHFKSAYIHRLYLLFFIPPVLPKKEFQINQKITFDNYILNFKVSEFDEGYEKQLLEKAVFYCPYENDLGDWHDFFILQEEIVRLNPVIYAEIQEQQILSKIKNDLLECVF